MTKTPVKTNDSCIKMFKFIKMLYQGEVPFKTVIELFSDGKYDGTSNTHVTINKYLNALKIFGIQVKKENSKYKMLSSLYKIKFDQDDIKSINLLKNACENLPNGKYKTNFSKFLHELEIRFDDNAKSYFENTKNTNSSNLTFYQAKLEKQITECEQYCQDKHKLEIVYTNDKKQEINLIGSPLEVIYLKRHVCLRVLSNNGNRIFEIPTDSIKSIKPLPALSSTQSIPTTVVFRIKNRLANNYKLRDWEKLETIESDGSHIIVNKNEDLDLLITRLMRYGTQCNIISPKFMKEEMIGRINETIKVYEN